MRSSALAFLASAPLCANAQQAVPLRYLATDVRIEGKALTSRRLWPVGLLTVTKDGRIIAWPNNSNVGIHAFNADGTNNALHVATGWMNQSEIFWPERIGRFHDDLWVVDGYARQVAFLSREGKVTGAVHYPTWVHAKWSERRKFPLFGGMQVVAVYPDSQLLIKPQRPHTLLDTPGYNRKITHLLRITPGGQIQREIAQFDENAWRIELRAPNQQGSNVQHVPFGVRATWSVADDGSRVAVVIPGTTARDSGTYRVISIAAQGDTVFDRRFPMAAVRVPQAQVDSALKAARGFGAITADSVRRMLRRKIPEFRSYVTDVIAGNDQSTWVITRSVIDSSGAREALVLDANGNPIHRVALPLAFHGLRADRDHLWGLDRGKAAIVRFRVQDTPDTISAPPPRTAPAAEAKVPARP